jgi:hypothetical protein
MTNSARPPSAAPEPGNGSSTAGTQESRGGPPFRSHFLPRTGAGWTGVLLFLAFLALAEPPIVDTLANRIYPWLFGFPFLYAYLLIVYVALIAVLVWAMRRGL